MKFSKCFYNIGLHILFLGDDDTCAKHIYKILYNFKPHMGFLHSEVSSLPILTDADYIVRDQDYTNQILPAELLI